MRATMLAIAAVFLLAACGGSGSSDEREAIEAIKDFDYDVPSWIEAREPGEHECHIDYGGPPALEESRLFDGLCRWDVAQDGADKLVTFTESWPCGIDGTDPCAHFWQYRVTPSGMVTLVEEGGPVAPQLWE